MVRYYVYAVLIEYVVITQEYNIIYNNITM